MIKAVIFDMDGLIINSEPLWKQAEIEAFRKVGVELTIEMCYQTVGLRIDEVINYWYEQFPWDNMTKKELEDEVMRNILNLVKEKGEPMIGVIQILDFLKTKNIKIALASSSQFRLINTVLDKLNIKDYFDLIYSAEKEKFGKPHPGVYITAAKKIGVKTQNCLAIEDSFNGILSAKSAKMKCLCVPDESIKGSDKLAIADLVIASLSDFNEDKWQKFNNFIGVETKCAE